MTAIGSVELDHGPVSCDFAYPSANKSPAWLAKRVSSVGRYITTNPRSSKALQPAERDQLLAAGLGIYLIWEVNEQRPMGGWMQGHTDGALAASAAVQLGAPARAPIYFAVDYDVWAQNTKVTEEYLRGCYDGLRAVNSGYQFCVYGDHDIAQRVADICEAVIVPNASAWSRGVAPYNVVARQGRQDKVIGWDYPTMVIRPMSVWVGVPVNGPVQPSRPPQPATTVPPVVAPAAPVPPVTADAAVLAASGDDDMFFFYNSDNPTDPARYACNGFVYRHIDEADANEMFYLGVARHSVAKALPRTTLQIAQMVRVGG